MLRLRDAPVAGVTILLWQERTPAKTLGERFWVNAESRSDPDCGNNAGINIPVDTRSAEAEKQSYLRNGECSLNPFDLVSKGNRRVECVSHPIEDDGKGHKLSRFVRSHFGYRES